MKNQLKLGKEPKIAWKTGEHFAALGSGLRAVLRLREGLPQSLPDSGLLR